MARKRVTDFYFSTNITIFNWVSLLNYFQDNKYNLTSDEIQMLADKSEQFRTLLNKPKKEEFIIRRAARVDQKIIKYTPGLGVEQKDVNPNIHQYLKEIL